MLRGRERSPMRPSGGPRVREQLIEAAEKTYRSDSYAEFSGNRDRCNSPC